MASFIFQIGYSTDVWDLGSDDTSRVSAWGDTAAHTGYRTIVTYEGMSGTYGLRGEPPMMISQEEHSKLQVSEERSDTKIWIKYGIMSCFCGIVVQLWRR